MDEENYRFLRAEAIPFPCVFEKSILTSRLCCGLAIKKNIADREVVQCGSEDFQYYCINWLELLRKKSQFALRLTDTIDSSAVLPHAKEMKIQVGGINGVAIYLAQKQQYIEREAQPNVSVTLELCRTISGDYKQLPFDQIVKSIAHYRVR